MCETCNEIICDKCEYSLHKGHKTESFGSLVDSDYISNILTMFSVAMKNNEKQNLSNFKDTITDNEKIVDTFFRDEELRVEVATKEVVTLLNNLQQKIKKLISLYKIKFKEMFKTVKEEYNSFVKDINSSNFHLF